MMYMWRKLWHDLWHGWKNTCLNVFIVTLGNGIWLGILNKAPEVTVGIFILGFTLLVAWAAPLQMDKAMHLCPMDRREKRRYLLRYYWLRVGVCFGLSASAHLAMAAVGWQSLPMAGLEVLLLAVYSLTAERKDRRGGLEDGSLAGQGKHGNAVSVFCGDGAYSAASLYTTGFLGA